MSNPINRRDLLSRVAASAATLVVSQSVLACAADATGVASADANGSTGTTPGSANNSCVLTASLTEGPYFVDEKLNRSDIRTDPADGTAQAGMPLSLTMVVVRADADCAPVRGAAVDIWHANAVGKYSDISSEGTSGEQYLRGVQVTDAAGQARFTTIYPGWYAGRAVHVHFKVRLFDGTSKTYEFTSQLFFDPSTTNTVYATSAYSSRGTPNTPNSADTIYGRDGSQLVVALTPDGNGGYAGTITARLSRSGTAIATKTQGAVAAGARMLELRIPRATAGAARA
jgi:protocatechuate 3,4-dioxygenase beta subunit